MRARVHACVRARMQTHAHIQAMCIYLHAHAHVQAHVGRRVEPLLQHFPISYLNHAHRYTPCTGGAGSSLYTQTHQLTDSCTPIQQQRLQIYDCVQIMIVRIVRCVTPEYITCLSRYLEAAESVALCAV